MKHAANSCEDKFSYTEEDIYEAMIKFVYHLARRYANEDLMFQMDELVGELMLELVKGVKYYSSKSLSMEQMKAVLRRMLDNRISELRHRHYGTHRIHAKFTLSLEIDLYDDDDGGMVEPVGVLFQERVTDSDLAPDPASVFSSLERVNATRALLSEEAARVFDACIFGDDRLAMFMWLSSVRASSVRKNGIVSLKPWIVADALMMSELEVKKAFSQIRRAYDEVANG